MIPANITPLDARSKHLRRLILRAFAAGGQGHIGPAFSLVEILRVLYDDVMVYDPKVPQLEERDRFILSKGHGYLALYALLADKGFIPLSELDNFCHAGALLGVHPSRHIPGVEFDTGSLGHGLSLGCGIAKAKPKRRVYVVMGDGECDEGAVWEAALYASKHKLGNLTVLVDCNGMQASGETGRIQPLGKLSDKWFTFGFGVVDVAGHNLSEIYSTLTYPIQSDYPLAIICHTVKGKGIAACENNPAWHHKSKVTPKEIKALYVGLENY
jgi:transketolase